MGENGGVVVSWNTRSIFSLATYKQFRINDHPDDHHGSDANVEVVEELCVVPNKWVHYE